MIKTNDIYAIFVKQWHKHLKIKTLYMWNASLTLPIWHAQDVLFGSMFAIIFWILLVFHPCQNGEFLAEFVVNFSTWNFNSIVFPIESKDCVSIMSVITWEMCSPITAKCWERKQVNALTACSWKSLKHKIWINIQTNLAFAGWAY